MNSFLLPEMNITNFRTGFILWILILSGITSFSQDSASAYKWNVTSKKLSADEYELVFSTNGNTHWQLYAPNQNPGDVATTEVQFNDSVFHLIPPFKDSGSVKTIKSSVFNMPIIVSENKILGCVNVANEYGEQ